MQRIEKKDISIKPTVSVIIPVYNMERFLPKCLDSLLKQKYSNLEIVIVNDGSTDSSSLICDSYSKKDNRIKYFYKANGGIADAYNFALKRATGDFIVFVDSDDTIEKNMIYDLVFAQNRSGADIVQTGMKIINENNNLIIEKKYNEKIYENNKELMNDFFLEKNILPCLASKLFKSTLFYNFEFEKGRNIVDILSMPILLLNSKKYEIINASSYIALSRNNSVSRGRLTEQTFSDLFYYLKKWESIITDNHLSECYPHFYYRNCYEMAYRYPFLKVSHNVHDKKNKKKMMIGTFKKYYPLLKKEEFFTTIPKKRKRVFTLFNISPFFLYVVFKIRLRNRL